MLHLTPMGPLVVARGGVRYHWPTQFISHKHMWSPAFGVTKLLTNRIRTYGGRPQGAPPYGIMSFPLWYPHFRIAKSHFSRVSIIISENPYLALAVIIISYTCD